MNIRDKFLELTKVTVPKDREYELLLSSLPDFLKKDPVGNLYYQIGESDTMFCSHLDTFCHVSEKVTHMFDGDFIRSNGKTILGADDKAGVVIMLYMIEMGIPGNYFFFLAEEKGCIGSGKLSRWMLANPDNEFKHIKKVISLDRSGYDSVITHMTFQRCCSSEFANALIVELNKFGFKFRKDPTGAYTDSAEFGDIFPECTNLSVGYFDQHKNHEKQNIVFLEKLANACCKINWDDIPTFRDPSTVEFADSYDDEDEEGVSNKHYIRDHHDDPTETLYDMKDKNIRIDYFLDKDYKKLSDISYIGDKIVDINLSPERIMKESDMIEDYLEKNEIDYVDLYWDGYILSMENSNGFNTKMNRVDLTKYIPELDITKINGFVKY